jgi:hypothetical protein
MNDPEPLQGGNSNRVFKEGNTVVRTTGVWSPFVHALLQYLTTAGFKESPVFLGQFSNSERLTYFSGEVGNYPLKPFMRSDEMVVEAAQLLRKYHDITQHFVVPRFSVFQLPVDPDIPHEVICHNDFAPYNLVFNENHIVGIIDFDTAGPGTRLWDIAYAVYRFAPLAKDAHCRDMGWDLAPDRAHRLKLFCDAYGLENRALLIETVIKRLEFLVSYMTKTFSNLDHLPIYTDDLRYLRENQQYFSGTLAT